MRDMLLTAAIAVAGVGVVGWDEGRGRAHRAPSADSAPAPSDRAAPGRLSNALAHLQEAAQPARDGGLVITNEHYVARFTAADGLAVTPRIAGRESASLTWRYKIRTIGTATSQRTLDPVAPAVSRAGDHVVDFERPGLIERYEGERTGVEQIFVLTDRPGGTGDVRITGTIDFAGAVTPTRGGLTFDGGADRAPFTYSQPIAFDAVGRSLSVRVELQASQLALVLEGEALVDAQFPVTIDPFYGVVTADSSTSGPEMADIAYNPDLGQFLVVYSYFPNGLGTHGEIRARVYLEQGDPVGSFVTVSTGQNDYEAHVAYDYHLNKYLVAWNRISSAPGASKGACARFVGSSGVPQGNATCISTMSDIRGHSIDVVARNQREHSANEAAFMVVWIDQVAGAQAVKSELISGNGAQMGEVQVAAGPADFSSVAYDPVNDRFFVTWVDNATAEVRGRTLATSGVPSSVLTIATNATHPQVGYDAVSRRYLVAWRSPANASPGNMSGRIYVASASPVPVGIAVTLQAQASGSARPYGVASGSGEFLVTYGRSQSKALHRLAVSPTGGVSGALLVDTNRGDDHRAGIAVGQHGFIMGAHSTFDLVASQWYLRVSNTGRRVARYVHGSSGDFDGDGRSDLFLYRLGTGTWEVRTQAGVSSHPFGVTSAVPVLLDWDADGLSDLATFNTATGQWLIRLTSTGTFVTSTLGRGGDIPVPGDYRGDACDEIGVFRPSTGEWLIRAHDEAVATVSTFGQVGDQPTPADWDGDGKVELGVWRGSTGVWHAAELDGTTLPQVSFAGPGVPLQGNFVGSAQVDQAFYQQALGVWTIRNGQTGVVQTVTPNLPMRGVTMPLDWEGDGALNIAWYDSELQMWFIIDQAMTTTVRVPFGQLGDIPAGAR